MLRAMSRLAVLALLIGACAACGKGAKSSGDPQKSAGAGTDEKIEVPTEGAAAPGAKGGPVATTGAPEDPNKLSDATKQRAHNPAFNLKPEEGTLTIAKAEAAAGAAATAEIKLAPATGYHVATDYPIKLWLEPPTGVTVEKTFLSAGGRNKAQGDAAALSEQGLAFAVKATPAAAGAFEITGVLSFGICEKDSCHPKTQPITIQVAAK